VARGQSYESHGVSALCLSATVTFHITFNPRRAARAVTLMFLQGAVYTNIGPADWVPSRRGRAGIAANTILVFSINPCYGSLLSSNIF